MALDSALGKHAYERLGRRVGAVAGVFSPWGSSGALVSESRGQRERRGCPAASWTAGMCTDAQAAEGRREDGVDFGRAVARLQVHLERLHRRREERTRRGRRIYERQAVIADLIDPCQARFTRGPGLVGMRSTCGPVMVSSMSAWYPLVAWEHAAGACAGG